MLIIAAIAEQLEIRLVNGEYSIEWNVNAYIKNIMYGKSSSRGESMYNMYSLLSAEIPSGVDS